MKTLSSFVEIYKPKSKDEQKFVDKHIILKKGDRNGNGDEVFNGSKIKKIDRKKERHGYDTEEGESVYESADPAVVKVYSKKGSHIGSIVKTDQGYQTQHLPSSTFGRAASLAGAHKDIMDRHQVHTDYVNIEYMKAKKKKDSLIESNLDKITCFAFSSVII